MLLKEKDLNKRNPETPNAIKRFSKMITNSK
jgi:hypothetical protein